VNWGRYKVNDHVAPCSCRLLLDPATAPARLLPALEARPLLQRTRRTQPGSQGKKIPFPIRPPVIFTDHETESNAESFAAFQIEMTSPGFQEELDVENGQRQRSQQRGPKAGPEQSWIKEQNRPLISRSNTYTYWLNQLYRDKYQGISERECVRGLWGVHGDCWGVISCWVMLRDSAVEDGASRYETHDTCEISRGRWQSVIRWGECVGRNLSQQLVIDQFLLEVGA